ncbi:MAG: polyphosphate kinase 1, partial [Bacteroidota bacterium]
PTHPFPQLKSLGMNLMVELRTPYRKDHKVAVIHIPSTLPRFIELPSENGRRDFVMLEDLIQNQARMLFPNMKILSVSEFRITRNADLDLAEAEADDLLKLVERELRKRRLGTIIRMEIRNKMSAANRKFLRKITKLSEDEIYEIPSYLDASAFMRLMGLNFPDLKDSPFNPALNPSFLKGNNIFEALSEGDVLLHHPYDSFQHVVDFIREAADDPQVLAIKQTLYRTNGDSQIVKALKAGVRNGKQVTALIELKARFDEQNNIEWAKDLDRSGVNVVYGVLGLKTHCKICMVVRKEGDQIRRYLHLSTGNYNEKTARIYTDLSLMTCDKDMGEDASGLFNLLTGYSMQKNWNKFLIAPSSLREGLREMITEVRKYHSEKSPARIIMVMNSLVDPDMIRELYKCSMVGVKVDLIIRGICCLRPGVKGISENIRVKSIVGRFLEHTRVFYFKSEAGVKTYMGSADLMQRNLNRRVELVFPIEDQDLQGRIESILYDLIKDDVKSRVLQKDGTYIREKGKRAFHVQEYLIEESEERQKHVDTISSLMR